MISSDELYPSSSFYSKIILYKFPILPLYYWALTSLLTSLHYYYMTFLTSLLASFVVVGHHTLSSFVVVGHYALSRISFCRRSATCFYFVGLYLHVVLFVCHPYFHKLLSLLHSFIAAGKPHSADFVDEFQ